MLGLFIAVEDKEDSKERLLFFLRSEVAMALK
jgi:hypothetical protein